MKTLKFKTPTGDEFIIREQTGNDDDIISNMSDGEATAINKFIQAIIVQGPEGKPLSMEEVEKMLLRDKYFILIKSRIFSYSNMLIFTYTWPNEYAEEFEVDLLTYIGDENTIPEPSFQPYEHGREVEVQVEDKTFKFNLLDGRGELMLLKLKPHQQTINQPLVARGLMVKGEQGGYLTVKNFGMFPSRILAKVRAKVEEVDPPVTADVEITNPDNGEIERIPIIAIRDFFFPVKF